TFTTQSTEELNQADLQPAGEALPVEEEIQIEENFEVRKGKGRFKARPTLTETGSAQESSAAGEVGSWRTEGVKNGAQAMQDFVVNPNPATAEEFEKRLNALMSEFPHGNIMDILMLVFMESIKDMNEDKKYFLKKLMMYNKMGEGLAKYLQEVLLPASDELGKAIAGGSSEDAGKKMVEIEVREHDTTSLGDDGEIMTKDVAVQKGEEVVEKNYSWFFGVDCLAADDKYNTGDDRVEYGPNGEKKVFREVNQMSLGNRIKGLESEQESVRNKRQIASTAFQNFDQKTNQLYNLLSSVLKALGEMRMGTTRNML
ncbi:MAG: hypothetical protein QGI45_03085, partial [Myxococcota bacterium]|nr:hypothetical protein [Myxococcota bacterium]